MGINYLKKRNPLVPTVSQTIPAQLEDRLGSGLKIPMNLVSGRMQVITGIDKIKQDIFMVLSTPIGRRLGQPDFGSELPFLPFQHYTPILRKEIQLATMEAIKTWIPQVTPLEVVIVEDTLNDNYVVLIIRLKIKGTDAEERVSFTLAMDDNIKLSPELFSLNGAPIFLKGKSSR